MDPGSESLNFGNHLVLDGFRGNAEALALEAVAAGFLREVAGLLGPTEMEERWPLLESCTTPRGISGVVVLPEASVAIHTFPDLDKCTVELFSRRNLPLNEVAAAVTARFGSGRIEYQLRHLQRPLPGEERLLLRLLRGDRHYAWCRLVDHLNRPLP